MLVLQCVMISICIRYKSNTKDNIYAQFWNWHTFSPYSNFHTVFTSIGIWCFFAVLTYFCLDSYVYFEFIGYLALLTEACLGMPQLISNFTKKSTYGLSRQLIAGWLIGDILKTAYFIVNEEPNQFVMCGEMQILIDILIVLQITMYSRNNKQVPSA